MSIVVLGVVGALTALFALLVGPGRAFSNGMAIGFFLLITLAVAQQTRRLCKTRNVSLLLVTSGAAFWYFYSNAMAAIFEPSRCLSWTTCFLPEEIVATFVYVCFFVGIFSITYGIVRHHAMSSKCDMVHPYNNRETQDSARLYVIGFVAIAAGLLPVFAAGFSVKELATYALLGRAVEKGWIPTSNIGEEGSALLWGARLLLVAGLTLVFARLLTSPERPSRKVLIFIAWCVPFLFQAFDTGTRYFTLSILLPGLVLKYFQKGGGIRAISVITALAGLVLFSQVQLLYRDQWMENQEQTPFEHMTLTGSMDFYHETANALRLHNELGSPLLDNDVLIFTTFLVPRSLWPEKPVTVVVEEYTFFRWGIDILREAGNVFPGLIGQYVLSFGALGPVLIGAVFGLLAAIIDRKLSTQRFFSVTSSLPMLCYAVGLFLSFRYLSPGYFVAPLLVHLGVVLARLGHQRRQWR